MTRYQNGANLERKVKKSLEAEGFFCVRSAGSKGPVDIVGIRNGYICFYQCKKNKKLPNKERIKLLEAKEKAKANKAYLAFPHLGEIMFEEINEQTAKNQ